MRKIFLDCKLFFTLKYTTTKLKLKLRLKDKDILTTPKIKKASEN
jgi:hypothetical protein